MEQDIDAYFGTVNGFQAHVKITSDLGESTLEYEMDYVYHKEDADSFTITMPESLAGISGTVAGTESAQFVVQYDGMELDDAMPLRPGLTPADGLFCLLLDLKNAEPVQQWDETVKGQKLLVLRYESKDEDGSIVRQVWLAADGLRPVYAEAYADGQRVLTLQLTEYQEII